MAKIKVTFTLDRATVTKLRQAAERLSRPKSQVVREAIHDYSERIGRLGERERLRMLRVFDEVIPRIPERPVSEVDEEIRQVRSARHRGGRKTAEKTSR